MKFLKPILKVIFGTPLIFVGLFLTWPIPFFQWLFEEESDAFAVFLTVSGEVIWLGGLYASAVAFVVR